MSKKTTDFNHLSYELHKKKEINRKKIEGWKNKKSIDYWLHERMYKQLLPLLENNPNASWLTVGDGRYGTDGHYIEAHGGQATITDISSVLLQLSKDDGYIKDFRIENAENLSFENQTFDFALCKEAYHHFPRPMVALYELIRVTKKAIVLMEPNDINIPSSPKISSTFFWYIGKILKFFIKKVQAKNPYFVGDYETTGNYVYSLSEREIEKVAFGLNFHSVAFLGINHLSEVGVEYTEKGTGSALEKRIKKSIKKLNLRSNLGISKPNLLVAMLFKENPGETVLARLKTAGYDVRLLTRNPYA